MKHLYSLLYLSILTTTTFTRATSSCLTETSMGELIDKITILQIKNERIQDPAKLINIRTELALLEKTLHDAIPVSPHLEELITELKETNTKLWIIEDDIREKEGKQEFDARFIELARSVYFTNDHRCKIKREINELLGSKLIEEKKYAHYNSNQTLHTDKLTNNLTHDTTTSTTHDTTTNTNK